MKKIVINTCFGGFSLSPQFYIKYAEALGKKAYFFKGIDDKEEVSPEDCEGGLFWSVYTVPNPQDYMKYPEGKNWHQMTNEEKDAYNKKYEEISLYDRDTPRDDPLLIRLIEELGEKVSGRAGDIKIVEIPDDVEWEIEEYDGQEWVSEKHRTWR